MQRVARRVDATGSNAGSSGPRPFASGRRNRMTSGKASTRATPIAAMCSRKVKQQLLDRYLRAAVAVILIDEQRQQLVEVLVPDIVSAALSPPHSALPKVIWPTRPQSINPQWVRRPCRARTSNCRYARSSGTARSSADRLQEMLDRRLVAGGSGWASWISRRLNSGVRTFAGSSCGQRAEKARQLVEFRLPAPASLVADRVGCCRSPDRTESARRYRAPAAPTCARRQAGPAQSPPGR